MAENGEHSLLRVQGNDGKVEHRSLQFDQVTGKLISTNTNERYADAVISVDMSPKGFFGGCFVVPHDKSEIIITPTFDMNEVSVKTMHISCQSDTYDPSHDYAGVAIYQYNDKADWRTANNTHCKSGYIVIQDTDSKKVKKWKNEPGEIHGAVYRSAFGESVNDADVVGEGFAIRRGGKLAINSHVFNNPDGSGYHDGRKRMHEVSEHCVRKVVECWQKAGSSWVRKRNFEVKELLEDFDLSSFDNY